MNLLLRIIFEPFLPLVRLFKKKSVPTEDKGSFYDQLDLPEGFTSKELSELEEFMSNYVDERPVCNEQRKQVSLIPEQIRSNIEDIFARIESSMEEVMVRDCLFHVIQEPFGQTYRIYITNLRNGHKSIIDVFKSMMFQNISAEEFTRILNELKMQRNKLNY